MNFNAANWKWLLESPLAPAWRSRLELCAGIVLSGAAVVALASAIRPDPEKLAARRGVPPIDSSILRPASVETPILETPPISREMIAAAKAGDVGTMWRAYRPGMPLDGTLSLAARSGHKDAVLWLLAHGANVHEQEHSAVSPVLAADAHPEIVALLRESGADEPMLVNAAEANARNAVTSILAAHPAQVKEGGALTASARSTLGAAADKRFVVTKLLEAGADPNDTYAGDSALGAAVRTCEDRDEGGEKADCMPIVRMLLDHDARVTGDALGNALSLEDATRAAPLEALLERPIAKGVTAGALARATSVNKEDLARVVKLGVDWAWHDGEEDAELPLPAAVQRGDRDFVRALLDAGAPVDVHFKDATCALAEAIDGTANDDGAHARIVELLVERGANVNRRFPDGRTPLFAAAESGNIRVVNFLLAHGASVNVRVLDQTALDAAEEHGNIPAARVLAAHGGMRARPTF
ncbi:MAG TPA: ankyrin repeat domain-containing protein [Labilithrix sp.]